MIRVQSGNSYELIPSCLIFNIRVRICCIYWYMPVLNMYSQCFRAVSFLMANVEVLYCIFSVSSWFLPEQNPPRVGQFGVSI